MKKSRFSEEQMMAILRESDRSSVSEAARKHKVSEPTIYAWRKHFGELAPYDFKRLEALELELENNRLKRLLAERDMDISVLKEINAKKMGQSHSGGMMGFASVPLWLSNPIREILLKNREERSCNLVEAFACGVKFICPIICTEKISSVDEMIEIA